jgi:hypothetical protein
MQPTVPAGEYQPAVGTEAHEPDHADAARRKGKDGGDLGCSRSEKNRGPNYAAFRGRSSIKYRGIS